MNLKSLAENHLATRRNANDPVYIKKQQMNCKSDLEILSEQIDDNLLKNDLEIDFLDMLYCGPVTKSTRHGWLRQHSIQQTFFLWQDKHLIDDAVIDDVLLTMHCHSVKAELSCLWLLFILVFKGRRNEIHSYLSNSHQSRLFHIE